MIRRPATSREPAPAAASLALFVLCLVGCAPGDSGSSSSPVEPEDAARTDDVAPAAATPAEPVPSLEAAVPVGPVKLAESVETVEPAEMAEPVEPV